mmetsp:Transcript_5719/g.9080  ORF Transcript_5719/g.9080 Transcript_5719/m.9080 type:complete len:193 (-) Transcript_5719:297-875(-)
MSMPLLAKQGPLSLDEVEAAFNEASMLQQHDSHVLTALGVLQFLRRDFGKAAMYFERAIKENPADHAVWNKYGAALANSANTEKAKEAYKLALDLRPNYVRTLVNIGLANSNTGDYVKALQCFLNALALNPKAKHIWNYARQTAIQGDRFDLLDKIDAQDISMFKGEFTIIDPQHLPKPNMDSLYAHPIFKS